MSLISSSAFNFPNNDAKARIEEDERLRKFTKPGGDGRRKRYGYRVGEDAFPPVLEVQRFGLFYNGNKPQV